MKKTLVTLILLLIGPVLAAQQMVMKDLNPLIGEWQGTLTYLDYSSQQEVSIPVNLLVEKRNNKTLIFKYIYPKEPKANSKATIKVGGNTLNGRNIVGKSYDNNYLLVVTEGSGRDNGKMARFTFTYQISSSFFSMRKDVEIDGEQFMRNRYDFSR